MPCTWSNKTAHVLILSFYIITDATVHDRNQLPQEKVQMKRTTYIVCRGGMTTQNAPKYVRQLPTEEEDGMTT